MMHVVAPYLASIGIHKNGTWAAQKIIDTAKLPSQIDLVCDNIKPYVPALLLDQFGNYVVQCCLGLGPERNQFIFDAIAENCWEIAQGRFGARAVRATLESPHVTKRQQVKREWMALHKYCYTYTLFNYRNTLQQPLSSIRCYSR